MRVAATLGPFGVVVARHHIVGILEAVEEGLYVAQFGIGPEIGNIPAHHHEINVGQGVDIVDAGNQVRPGFRTHRIVVVRDKGDADRFSALLIPQRFERMFRVAGPVIQPEGAVLNLGLFVAAILRKIPAAVTQRADARSAPFEAPAPEAGRFVLQAGLRQGKLLPLRDVRDPFQLRLAGRPGEVGREEGIIGIGRLFPFVHGHEQVTRMGIVSHVLHAPVGIAGVDIIGVRRLGAAVMVLAENHAPCLPVQLFQVVSQDYLVVIVRPVHVAVNAIGYIKIPAFPARLRTDGHAVDARAPQPVFILLPIHRDFRVVIPHRIVDAHGFQHLGVLFRIHADVRHLVHVDNGHIEYRLPRFYVFHLQVFGDAGPDHVILALERFIHPPRDGVEGHRTQVSLDPVDGSQDSPLPVGLEESRRERQVETVFLRIIGDALHMVGDLAVHKDRCRRLVPALRRGLRLHLHRNDPERH